MQSAGCPGCVWCLRMVWVWRTGHRGWPPGWYQVRRCRGSVTQGTAGAVSVCFAERMHLRESLVRHLGREGCCALQQRQRQPAQRCDPRVHTGQLSHVRSGVLHAVCLLACLAHPRTRARARGPRPSARARARSSVAASRRGRRRARESAAIGVLVGTNRRSQTPHPAPVWQPRPRTHAGHHHRRAQGQEARW